MRIRKFRVWYRAKNKMIYNCCFNKQYVFSYTNNAGEQTVYPIDDCIIMEATGIYDNTKFKNLPPDKKEEFLKSHNEEDWNGTEIYEGDVVKVRFSKDISEYSVVSYSSHNAQYWKGSNALSSYQKLTSVVGNLYEGYPDAAKRDVEYYKKYIMEIENE